MMRKVILVPDSFKGTMSSAEICGVMAPAVRRWAPAAQIVSVPVADGGEGSADAFLAALGGRRPAVRVAGPWGAPVDAFYALLPDGTAVVEMAAAAGLPLAGPHPDAGRTTTFGVGQLMDAALAQGAKKILLALGGSATNDGGCGAAAALGAQFFDAAGRPFVPVGDTLEQIAAVRTQALQKRLAGVPVVAMCDIDNPLCGENGAAAVFGPQKGAGPAEVARLDAGLAHLAAVLARDLGCEILALPGAGAAGGMGGGAAAFFGARLQPGIGAVLDTVGFDGLLAGADLVLTGEGRLDTQSLRGKVVLGVAARARRAGVPVIAVVGDIGPDIEPVYDAGVIGVFSTNRAALPWEQARPRAKSDLALTMDNLMRLLARTGLGAQAKRKEGDTMEFTLEENRIFYAENGRTLAWITFPARGEGVVTIDHTFVDESLRGRGVAAAMTARLADELARTGRRAVLVCPYAKKWWAAHPERADLLA